MSDVEYEERERVEREAEAYSERFKEYIEGFLESKKSAAVIYEENGWGVEGDESYYIKKLVEQLPPLDRTVKRVFIHDGTGWERVKIFREKLLERLGIEDGDMNRKLNFVDTDHWQEHHNILVSSTNPLVIYHSVGSESPRDAYGGGAELVTVNLTEDQIREMAKKAGARIEKKYGV